MDDGAVQELTNASILAGQEMKEKQDNFWLYVILILLMLIAFQKVV